jgi:hypothetical protein
VPAVMKTLLLGQRTHCRGCVLYPPIWAHHDITKAMTAGSWLHEPCSLPPNTLTRTTSNRRWSGSKSGLNEYYPIVNVGPHLKIRIRPLLDTRPPVYRAPSLQYRKFLIINLRQCQVLLQLRVKVSMSVLPGVLIAIINPVHSP